MVYKEEEHYEETPFPSAFFRSQAPYTFYPTSHTSTFSQPLNNWLGHRTRNNTQLNKYYQEGGDKAFVFWFTALVVFALIASMLYCAAKKS